jgi:hypothetical protein
MEMNEKPDEIRRPSRRSVSNKRYLPSRAMRKKVVISFACGLLLVAGVGWLSFNSFQRDKLQVSVRLLGYTNASFDTQGLQTHEGLAVCTVPDGAHAVVLQVSNASPFAVVRARSPLIMFDSPTGPFEYVPTGWNVLQPRECERFELEPPTNGVRWRMMVGCERFPGDSYGAGPPDFRARVRRVAIWLQDHRVPVPVPGQRPAVQFSSDWIEP